LTTADSTFLLLFVIVNQLGLSTLQHQIRSIQIQR